MLQALADFTQLSPSLMGLFALTCCFAGLIRGFSGFALSATVMASMSSFMNPVSIIPIAFLLELVAAIFMVRGRAAEADMRMVWGLFLGNVIGVPIGLYALTKLDASMSKIIALSVICTLAILLFARVKAPILATRPGLLISGLAAGMASGIASVGGMVVALYVLARDRNPAEMRASLVMFLMLSMSSSVIFLFFYEIMTLVAVKRMIFAAPFAVSGILLGSYLFRPSFAHLYKPVCLLILMALCIVGLARQFLS